MAYIVINVLLACTLSVGGYAADVRLVGAAGATSSGLLQVRTDAGFGSVCGANAAAADAACPAKTSLLGALI